MAYETTTVPVERSQGAIRTLLAGHGADAFAFGEERDDDGRQWALVQFANDGHRVRMRVPHKPVDQRELSRKYQRARRRTRDEIRLEVEEQEAKRIWRVMHWNLKSRMVAVQEGVETFEEAFLAHLLDPATGRTVYEQLAETGSITLSAPLRPELEAGDTVDGEIVG